MRRGGEFIFTYALFRGPTMPGSVALSCSYATFQPERAGAVSESCFVSPRLSRVFG